MRRRSMSQPTGRRTWNGVRSRALDRTGFAKLVPPFENHFVAGSGDDPQSGSSTLTSALLEHGLRMSFNNQVRTVPRFDVTNGLHSTRRIRTGDPPGGGTFSRTRPTPSGHREGLLRHRSIILVGEDIITIRHSIPIPSAPPQNGGSEALNGRNYLLCKGRDGHALWAHG